MGRYLSDKLPSAFPRQSLASLATWLTPRPLIAMEDFWSPLGARRASASCLPGETERTHFHTNVIVSTRSVYPTIADGRRRRRAAHARLPRRGRRLQPAKTGAHGLHPMQESQAEVRRAAARVLQLPPCRRRVRQGRHCHSASAHRVSLHSLSLASLDSRRRLCLREIPMWRLTMLV
ncbi:hypothetical protein VTK73DRAFT_2292 [Phialemonium thermophilum]|uniref:Uncharacterized protein n=1 Tax=Phialemonium thermophilum TaxID=223376 RepID=A0ABR3VSC4_9PEZI